MALTASISNASTFASAVTSRGSEHPCDFRIAHVVYVSEDHGLCILRNWNEWERVPDEFEEVFREHPEAHDGSETQVAPRV